MTALQKMEVTSMIEEDEFDSLTEILFHSVSMNRQYKSQSAILKKEELIENLISFLNKSLALKVTAAPKHKLQIINLICKLTQQKELIQIQTGKLNLEHIKAAAITMGKKTQWAVGIK